jgi:hypothetical protein
MVVLQSLQRSRVTPWFQTSGLQSWQRMHLSAFSHPACSNLSWAPWVTNMLFVLRILLLTTYKLHGPLFVCLSQYRQSLGPRLGQRSQSSICLSHELVIQLTHFLKLPISIHLFNKYLI